MMLDRAEELVGHGVEHLAGLLGERHPTEQIGNALRDGQIGLAIRKRGSDGHGGWFGEDGAAGNQIDAKGQGKPVHSSTTIRFGPSNKCDPTRLAGKLRPPVR